MASGLSSGGKHVPIPRPARTADSVPAFALALDRSVEVPGIGHKITPEVVREITRLLDVTQVS